MRILVLACAIAACGGATAKTESRPVARPVTAPSRPAPTRSEMLAAFPVDTTVLVALDVRKLRQSPLAKRAWDLVLSREKVASIIEEMCGVENHVTYALISLNVAKHEFWAWMSGLSRTAQVDCPAAKERRARHPHKSATHGDYTLRTSEEGIDESLWVDDNTVLMVVRKADATPLGEQRLRDTIASGGGLTSQTPIGAMLDHVDFSSGAVLALDGELLKRPGVQGLAASVEADDGIRAQLYVQFDNEDRASNLHTEYRAMIEKALERHMIDAGDTRLNGGGIAASVSLSAAQIDKWIEVFRAKAAGASAPSSATP